MCCLASSKTVLKVGTGRVGSELEPEQNLEATSPRKAYSPTRGSNRVIEGWPVAVTVASLGLVADARTNLSSFAGNHSPLLGRGLLHRERASLGRVPPTSEHCNCITATSPLAIPVNPAPDRLSAHTTPK